MTTREAPAPVANLREAKKAQAATRQAQAEAKQRHPAGKAAQPAAKATAKPAPAKAAKAAAAKPAAEAQKVTYTATARCGKVNSRVSATPLAAALDVKVSGKKQPHWSAGVIVSFYASADAAQKVADEINGGAVDGWSEAVVVAAQPVAAVALLVAMLGVAAAVALVIIGLVWWVRGSW